MYKLAVFLFLTTTSAKLNQPKYDYVIFEQFNRVEEPNYAPKRSLNTESAWVLNLNGDVEDLKLRAAANDEVKEVFPASRLNNGPRQGRRVKKDDPTKQEPSSSAAPETIRRTDGDEKAFISEIMRVINKFVLTSQTEPDAYITEDTESTPTIKLYFKGDHTSLVVRAEGKQWHYIIGPPALFPEWFYEEHTKVGRDTHGVYVSVPRAVRIEFYSVMIHMLTMFLRLPA